MLDEKNALTALDEFNESTVLSIIEIMQNGRDYERLVVRGRIIGLGRLDAVSSTGEYRLRRIFAAIPVFRTFCEPKHQNRVWFNEYLTDLEHGFKNRGVSEMRSTQLMPAYAFVQCIDFEAYPDDDHAQWIMANLEALEPYAATLLQRGDWSREFLDELLGSSLPALADGVL